MSVKKLLKAWFGISPPLARGTAGTVGADASKRRYRPAPPYPVGRWRCTRADDHFAHYFTPGETYFAKSQPDTAVIRIHHDKGGPWAPSFDHEAGRFCYRSHELDFEYLGAD